MTDKLEERIRKSAAKEVKRSIKRMFEVLAKAYNVDVKVLDVVLDENYKLEKVNVDFIWKETK